MPPLVLAVEPDHRQALVLKRIVRERLGTELVLADTKDGALAVLGDRVPDLVLLTALLSPRDENELAEHLRRLDGAGHVQTLTIPLLASDAEPEAEPKKRKGGLLGKFSKKSKAAPAAPTGCDPSVFGDELMTYYERGQEIRAERAARPPRETHREPEVTAAPIDPWADLAPPDYPPVYQSILREPIASEPIDRPTSDTTDRADADVFIEPPTADVTNAEPIVSPTPTYVPREPATPRKPLMWLDRATTVAPRPELDAPFIIPRPATVTQYPDITTDLSFAATDQPDTAEEKMHTIVADDQSETTEETHSVFAGDPETNDEDTHSILGGDSETTGEETHSILAGDPETNDEDTHSILVGGPETTGEDTHSILVDDPKTTGEDTHSILADDQSETTDEGRHSILADAEVPAIDLSPVIDLSSALDIDLDAATDTPLGEPDFVVGPISPDALAAFESPSSDARAGAFRDEPDPDRIELLPTLSLQDFEKEFEPGAAEPSPAVDEIVLELDAAAVDALPEEVARPEVEVTKTAIPVLEVAPAEIEAESDTPPPAETVAEPQGEPEWAATSEQPPVAAWEAEIVATPEPEVISSPELSADAVREVVAAFETHAADTLPEALPVMDPEPADDVPDVVAAMGSESADVAPEFVASIEAEPGNGEQEVVSAMVPESETPAVVPDLVAAIGLEPADAVPEFVAAIEPEPADAVPSLVTAIDVPADVVPEFVVAKEPEPAHLEPDVAAFDPEPVVIRESTPIWTPPMAVQATPEPEPIPAPEPPFTIAEPAARSDWTEAAAKADAEPVAITAEPTPAPPEPVAEAEVRPKRSGRSPVAAARMLIAAAARSLGSGSRKPLSITEPRTLPVQREQEPAPALAPPPPPPPKEEPPAPVVDAHWIATAIDGMRTDIKLLREQHDRNTTTSSKAAAPAAPPPAKAATRAEKPRRKAARKPKRKAPARPKPIQDEWGLYDPNQCGFEALMAEIESRQREEEEREQEQEPDAADLLLQQEPAVPAAPPPPASSHVPALRLTPLAMWARMESADSTTGATVLNRDDLLGLIEGLRLPAPVASVRYATGCRIRRVRIAKDPEAESAEQAAEPVVILSKKALRNTNSKNRGASA